MAVRVRVEINDHALRAVVEGPGTAALLTKYAEQGAAHVRRTQRLSNRKGDIVVSAATPQRMRATFGSTSSFWHLEEFGSANNPPYRTLTNAANTLGISAKG